MTEHRAGSDVPTRVRRRSVVLGIVVAVVLVVLDQVTKQLAESLLEQGRFVPLIGDHIGWQLVYNQGGAFGLPAPHWLFLIVTVIVVIVVGQSLPRTQSKVTATAFGMLLAGALGNVIDRIFRDGATDAFGGGAVVDFVAWGTFPRFNVADSAITVGFALLVIGLWREERSHAHEDEAAEALTRGASEDTGIGHVTVLTFKDDGEEAAVGSADEPAGGDAGLGTIDEPVDGDAAVEIADPAGAEDAGSDGQEPDESEDGPAVEDDADGGAGGRVADDVGMDALDPDDPSHR